jgi:hypothetical protein
MAEANPIPIPFWAVIAAGLIANLALGRVVYQQWYYLVAVFLVGSALIYQLLLWLFARQWAFNPTHQYPSAWYGDLIVLPFVVALPLWLLYHHLPRPAGSYWFGHLWWQVVSFLIAYGIAFYFRTTQDKFYPPIALNAPWRVWHDEVAFTFLAYVLILGAPAIWYSSWGLSSLFGRNRHWTPGILLVGSIAVGLFVFFVVLAGILDRTMDVKATSRNHEATVVGYDWLTNTVTDQLVVEHLPDGSWRWALPNRH